MTKQKNSDQGVRVGDSNSDLFVERLNFIIKRLGGVAKAARIAGVAESTVRKWRNALSEPQRPYLIPLANEAEVNVAWLVAGERPIHKLNANQREVAIAFDKYKIKMNYAGQQARMFFERDYHRRKLSIRDEICDSIPEVTSEELVKWHSALIDSGYCREESQSKHQASALYRDEGFSLIPLYDVSASAGHGADIGQEHIASQIAFRQDWLHNEGLAVKGLAVITAQGDSMEPTIADGALLLVDSTQRQITNDSIYILRWDGRLYAKRLQLMFSQAVRIISDNKAYTEETISPDEATGLDIVGRVVWVGQKI